jgi:exonuclease III
MLSIKKVIQIIITGILLFANGFLPAQDTLTIMYYNTLNYPGSTPERVQYFRTINQFILADIVIINELNSNNGALSLLEDGLNVYNNSNYEKALFIDGPDSDNMLFYNSVKLGLYSQDTIHTELRLINEYVLFYKSPLPEPDTVFMYFYSAHLKASSGSENQQKRLQEIQRFKQHIDNLQGVENVIFGGDLNIYGSSEPAYQSLINDGTYPLNDPLPAGDWHDNEAFSAIHTQSTRTAQFGGGATGGMDDRFDFIMFSDDVENGSSGIKYVSNSCLTLGNDGNHFNKAITDEPSNNSLPDSVLQALYFMSDHLPVIAKISVSPSTVQERPLNIKVTLEGPYKGPGMSTELNPVLPLSQPYFQPPWNYQGQEAINTVVNPDIVDWVLVEIRKSTGDASTATYDSVIWQRSCFLNAYGIILDTNQYFPPTVPGVYSNHLYVVVRHRNHLAILSNYPMNTDGGYYSFDFTDSENKVFGGINGYKQLFTGTWGMAAGDINADGMIGIDDRNDCWRMQAGKSGYLREDINLDKQVNNQDINEFLLGNNGLTEQLPENSR